jgi:hypothetical protein
MESIQQRFQCQGILAKSNDGAVGLAPVVPDQGITMRIRPPKTRRTVREGRIIGRQSL